MGTSDIQLVLISQEMGFDDIGNEIVKSEAFTHVLGDEISVTRNEFYAAAKEGLKPEKEFRIKKYEYADEKIVGYKGKRYSVTRTYAKGTEDIYLTCEAR